MSLINDALKKAGHQADLLPNAPKKRSRFNWGPLFVLGILVLITTPLMGPLFHQPYLNQSSTSETPLGQAVPPQSPNMKGQFAVEEAPILPPAKTFGVAPTRTPNFALSGLVYSSGGSYCLINGKVIKVGESVGGATLVEVTPNRAVLDFRGEKIVLTSQM